MKQKIKSNSNKSNKKSVLPPNKPEIIHKTLLEYLYEKGWLDYPKSPYSSSERLRIGLKLMYNYQLLKKANLHSGFVFNNRVDSHISLESKMYDDALDFYRRSLRAVPSEFWGILRLICLEEKMPEIPDNISERQQAHISYLYRMDLCRGLDRLILHTTKN